MKDETRKEWPISVRKLHDQWAKMVLPANASEVQRIEMERAFFAGAWSLIGLLRCRIADLPDDEAVKALESLETETELYFRELNKRTGRRG